MSLLFAQYWDIIEEKEDGYAGYFNDAYLPAVAAIGLIPVGGYHVEIGFGPRTIVVFSSESISRKWKRSVTQRSPIAGMSYSAGLAT